MDCEGGLHEESVESLIEAIATGVNVIMVTGKVGLWSHGICSCNGSGTDLKWRLVF